MPNVRRIKALNIRPRFSPKLFRFGDIILILSVVVFAVILFICTSSVLFADPTEKAVVTVNANGSVYEYSLYEERTFTLESNGITVTISISEESVWIESSDCPDKTCKSMGRINREGQSIICVPAKLVIKISSQTASDGEVNTDAIVR